MVTTQQANPRQVRDAIGRPVEQLDTPALVLDLDASERNLQRLATYFSTRPSKLRPHFKNHKCLTLARRQFKAGSVVGFTCAKLGEAEVLVQGGYRDILIANQVVGAPKVRRLVALASQADLSVAVDHPAQAEAISEAAHRAGVTVGLLVEVDIGMGRCGVMPGPAALELVRAIEELPGTRFLGIQAFEGHAIYINDAQERSKLAREAMQKALDTRQLLEDAGIQVSVISGGSTANHDTMAELGVEEIQAGTYATMDWRYHEVRPELEVAMYVLATVISTRPGEAVLDVGAKGAGAEFGVPQISGAPGVEIPHFLAEEHCLVRNAPGWQVGDKVHLLSSHACTTCNLHRQFFVARDGQVIDIWPIEASGLLS